MTLFEYLAIAFSLVFSFTALRLLGGFTHTLDKTSRYWVHAVQNLVVLMMVVVVFWVFWSFRDVHWTFPKFVLALSAPSALYFAANTLIPDDPSAVMSWRDYYFTVRVKFFAALGLWALLTVALSTVLLDIPILHPTRIGQMTILSMVSIGIGSTNPRVHGLLSLSMLVAVILFGLFIFSNPDAVYRAGK